MYKPKFNFDLRFMSVWIGAVVCALIAVGLLNFWAGHRAEKAKIKHLSDPRLDNVELKIPNFEQGSLESGDVEALLVGAPTGSAMAVDQPMDDEAIAPQVAWSYTGAAGPEFWSGLTSAYEGCGQKNQSPIDLPLDAKPDRDLQPIRFIYQDLPGQLHVDSPVIKFTPVQGHTAVMFDETFYLHHVEFHLPSEHQLNGVGYDMEIQFYHRNVAGQWAAVAVLANESKRTHGELKKILSAVPKKTERPADLKSIDLNRFLPELGTYLHYEGSPTSPPCSPRVKWAVLVNPIAVSDAQVDAMAKVKGFTSRPIQERDGRQVGKSWH